MECDDDTKTKSINFCSVPQLGFIFLLNFSKRLKALYVVYSILKVTDELSETNGLRGPVTLIHVIVRKGEMGENENFCSRYVTIRWR